MEGDLFTIGQAARRTGLEVRTIRFYADEGVVAPAARSESGYRLYDAAALQRLELVRTLRELGFGLSDIRRVLAREATPAAVAGAHAELLEAQIGALVLRRSVVRAIATGAHDHRELTLMTKLARMSDEERQATIDEFLDHVFDGLDVDPGFVARIRSGRPVLPEDPTPEQVEAWIELAELVRDESFRTTIRAMAERQAAETAAPDGDWTAVAERVHERAGAAQEAGTAPESQEGLAIAEELAPLFAGPADHPADPAFRLRLGERLASGTDARAERYWQLLAVMNGWSEVPTTTPAWRWLADALRASAA